MLTTVQIAKELGVSSRLIQMYCRSGELKCYKFDRQYRIDEKDYEEFKKRIRMEKKENEK